MKARTPIDFRGHDLTTCIAACAECHDTCEEMTYQHCLKLGGRHADPAHLMLMADCAEICRTCADFMLRGSSRYALACGICAEICDQCAADCDQLGDMEECITACRRCADACREMAHG